MRAWLIGLCLGLLAAAPARAEFDHRHAAWDALLKKHVRWLPDGRQSRVDYGGFMADRAALRSVLDDYSAVTPAMFEAFGRERQMALLINAYNAFTVELVLTRWPELKSIKELGSLFSSPWEKAFFTLLGEPRTLDWIEHEQLRPRYRDPRIHAAVNCASIGCPALRDEAFTAARLDAQLDDGMRRFLSDRTRNRATPERVEANMIFRWYREDFERGDRGIDSLGELFASHAEQLSDDPAVQRRLRELGLPVHFLPYDWALNAVGR